MTQNETAKTFSLVDAFNLGNYYETSASDPFVSNVAIAYFTYSCASPSAANVPQNLLQSLEHTPRCLFSYHAALLAAHTPVRDLLAVSGESFVFGEKLATRDQFSQAIDDLRAWIADQRALPALQHAVQLLHASMQNGRCGLIHEDWALTIAALVCWACIMWPAQKEVIARMPSPLPPVNEADGRAVKAISGAKAWSEGETPWQQECPIDWWGARACVAWAKSRMEGRIGWLVQDGVGVLRKLEEGRQIDV